MKSYIPFSAVVREQSQQVRRRLHIEKQHEAAILALKEQLKTKRDILTELTALGLTLKHAANLQERLRFVIDLERRADEAREAKRKAAEVKSEETLTVTAEQFAEAVNQTTISTPDTGKSALDALESTQIAHPATLGTPQSDESSQEPLNE